MLPPGPGGVHRLLPRRTRPSTSGQPSQSLADREPRGGIRSRYSGLRVQGTASSPSSTTGDNGTSAVVTCQMASHPPSTLHYSLITHKASNPLTRGRHQRHTSERVQRAIERGEMPPSIYLILHPDARLTAAEKQTLVAGMARTLAQTPSSSTSLSTR